jgi:potassium/hydrogen antiporter
VKPRLRLFTTGPWDARDGDPASPEAVAGLPVIGLLRARGDAPGALVRLPDRRYALTGTTVTVGRASQLRRYLRSRRPRSAAHELWLTELERALAAESDRDQR